MILQCPGCRKRLSLDDRNAGKMVKCPACAQQFRAGSPASQIAQPVPAKPPAPPASNAGADFEVVDDDAGYEVVDETPPAPPPRKASAETVRNAIAPVPTQRLTPPENDAVDDVSAVDEEDAEEERRPRKKKKKKRVRRDVAALPGNWIPWAVGVGGLLLFLGALALAGILAGHGTLVLFVTVWLVVSIPVSTVILIVSMILSSAIAGGIEFGEVHVVIPKAMGLLIIINLISMIPIAGWIMTFPVWLLGLMFLFRLDIWEARFLIFINWFLNTIARWVLTGILLAVVFHTGDNLGSPGRHTLDGPDAEAQELIWDGGEELRGWLHANPRRIVFGRSHDQSLQLCNDLYSMGAKKVWAGDPMDDVRSGVPRTKKVVVQLPADAGPRQKLIEYHNELARRYLKEFAPQLEDHGQTYLVLDFDPDLLKHGGR